MGKLLENQYHSMWIRKTTEHVSSVATDFPIYSVYFMTYQVVQPICLSGQLTNSQSLLFLPLYTIYFSIKGIKQTVLKPPPPYIWLEKYLHSKSPKFHYPIILYQHPSFIAGERQPVSRLSRLPLIHVETKKTIKKQLEKQL